MTSQEVAGRYELAERIGSGSMATVWRARDTRLSRDVAVKILDLSTAADDTLLARFRREAVATAGLNHPNIVSVMDAGTEDGRAYIVMQLVTGRSVAQLLRDDGPAPLSEALDIAAQVASALAAAHAVGLVHRDIKPANVMVGATGHATVLDFGIAHLADADVTLTAPASAIGSAAYMSPEQASGTRVGPASDVYSLGCLVMAMLTGQPPFHGGSAVEVAGQQVTAPPPALSERVRVPHDLDLLVTELLAKVPAERPTAGETLTRLREIAREVDNPPPRRAPAATTVLPSSTTVLPASTTVLPTAAATAAGPSRTPLRPVDEPAALLVAAAPLASAPEPPSAPPRRDPAPRRRGSAAPVVVLVLLLVLGALAFAFGTGRIGPLSGLSSPAPATTTAPTTSTAPTGPATARTSSSAARPTSSAPRTSTAPPSTAPATTAPRPSGTTTTTAATGAPATAQQIALQVAVQTVRGGIVNLPPSPSKDSLLASWDDMTPDLLARKDTGKHLDSFTRDLQVAVAGGDLTVAQGIGLGAAVKAVQAAS